MCKKIVVAKAKVFSHLVAWFCVGRGRPYSIQLKHVNGSVFERYLHKKHYLKWLYTFICVYSRDRTLWGILHL
jgi:hypothetical protein